MEKYSDQNDLDPNHQDNIFEEEDYPSKKISILSQKLNKRSVFPVAIWIFLSLIFSYIHWIESYDTFLWVDRFTITQKGEYWRLITSIFVHADLKHFLSNILLLFVFGLLLHNYYGKIAFPLISLFIGITTNALTIYFYPMHTKIVGASGMIYGMVALWVVWYLRYDIRFSISIRCLRSAGFLFVMMLPTTYVPRTSYISHGLGFVIGCLFAIALLPIMDKREKRILSKIDIK